MAETLKYDPKPVRNGIYQLKSGHKDKNLILIHGLNGDGDFNKETDHMRAFYEALDGTEGIEDYNVWTLTYNTWLMPFDVSGNWLANDLRELQGYDFSKAIVVGYSMGGLIARTLISNGFNFRYLITIDTPHHGPLASLNIAAWLYYFVMPARLFNLIAHGIDSLICGSGSQNLIHNSPLDQARRKTSYACYAIDHRLGAQADLQGHDGVVPVHSQLGLDMGEVRWRAVHTLTYADGNLPAIKEPHTLAPLPANCQEVIDLVKLLVGGGEMPARTLKDTPASAPGRSEAYGMGKPPVELSDWAAWYWFDKLNIPQIRIRMRVVNKDTKPLRLPFTSFFTSKLGIVRPLEATSELMLAPGKPRDILFAVDNPVIGETMPDEVEVMSFGEVKKLPLFFVPLEVDPTGAIPQESLWSLDLGATASATQSDDGYFTEVKVKLTVNNPSPCAFYLDPTALDIRLDVTTEPFYSLLGESSDVAESKRVRIAPNTATNVSLAAQWARGVARPNKVKVLLGGDVLRAGEVEAPAR